MRAQTDWVTRKQAITVTRKQTVLAVLDALITGTMMFLVLGMAGVVFWLAH